MGELEAVTTMVCPALVITEGAAVCVTVGSREVEADDDADPELEPDPGGELSTSLSRPVNATVQKPSPPQSAWPYPLQGELQLELEATVSVGGRRSPQ